MRYIKQIKNLTRVHLEMIKAVVAFALNSANVAITNSIPSFGQVITMLKSNLTAITNLEAIAGLPVTGYASQKLALKNTLAEFSAAILQSVAAYAVKTQNQPLLNKVQTTRGRLLNMSYAKLIEFITAAINAVDPIVNDLEEYNITPETISLWRTNLSQLNDVYSNPKNQHKNQNQAKKDIAELIRTCMELLYNQADQIAIAFKENNLSYYQQYTANRKLIPLTRHTKFRVTVTNDTNQPIPNVTITQDDTGNFTKTDINGNASLRIKVEEGKDPLYNFTLTSGTKNTQTGLIEIKRGQTISRSYQIAQDGFIIPEHQPQQAQKAYVKR